MVNRRRVLRVVWLRRSGPWTAFRFHPIHWTRRTLLVVAHLRSSRYVRALIDTICEICSSLARRTLPMYELWTPTNLFSWNEKYSKESVFVGSKLSSFVTCWLRDSCKYRLHRIVCTKDEVTQKIETVLIQTQEKDPEWKHTALAASLIAGKPV